MSSFQAGPFNQAQTPQGTSTSFLQQGVSRDVVDDNLHDLNILWGSLDTFPLEGFGRGLPNELITLPELDIPESINSELTAPMTGDTLGNVRLDSPLSDDDASLSNFQLPPLQHNEDSQDTDNVLHTSESIPSEPHIPWRISKEDYQLTLGKIEHVRHILPESFSFPSKYVFCRYIEGYFTGSHGHLPFLHLPTVTVAHLTPALVLAIMAMGAQYRFEQARAVKFYKASRALINDHINLHSTSNSLYTPGSQLDTIDRTEKTHFEVLQAQIILTTLGTWGNHDLLHDTLGMAGQMSLYLQDSGLLLHDRHSDDGSWLAWIQQEGQRRTKYIAYMICNVQTILYNMPPKILNSEITSILLPWPEELWSATCAADWKSLRSKWAKSVTFGEVYSQLFRHQPNHRIYSSLSSFGYLILIHGIFQQIYLAWESSCCLPGSSEGHPMALPHELLTRFHTALRRWQKGWETSSDPSITPASPKGPLGFNATAIFRIACIRLHFNLGPHRNLGTADPDAIASSFCNAPRPTQHSLPTGSRPGPGAALSPQAMQTPQIYHAILQSIHALSIPVRLGVEYVARTQTLTWSTIHSLCNLECALFLCKWLETLALNPTDLHRDTRRLLRIILSVLREADLAQPGGLGGEFGAQQLRRMGAVLVRLLSKILKGDHVFEMMHVFCDSLQIYANRLENDIDSDISA
ncbi:hypothetical protein N7468_002557 [Penicillium chermesinum]|uniref:Xylanolytic transcriptional activator regulatory domain-containing protein n=1 Tax=Penicillium chermesinum TaxID=63820 RepID=A0A9W9PIY6_9EURO|nr:uncharacterized protein N7468_002557 [Penicillium chermesinum]KAJ5247574.1 hypothetical protein N7468_002557 [Penicillium chermesinum]